MFCMNCGQELPPDAFFCPNCGQKVETASEDAPAGMSAPQPQKKQSAPSAPPKLDCGIGLGIVAVVLAHMLGLIGLVFAVLASNTLQKGDYEGARRLARIGKAWSWTGIILSILGICLGVLVFLFGILLAMDGSAHSAAGDFVSNLMEQILPGLREALR